MDDPFGVRRCKHVAELNPDGQDRLHRQAPSAPQGQLLESLPFEQLHDEERRAVVRHVVVEHRHPPGVLDGVGGLAFAKEAHPDVRSQRQLRVKHLDGDVAAVPVAGGVDGRHPADPQDPGERVLPSQHGSEARPGSFKLLVLCHHLPSPIVAGRHIER